MISGYGILCVSLGPIETCIRERLWSSDTFWTCVHETRVHTGNDNISLVDIIIIIVFSKPTTFATFVRNGKKKVIFGLPG